MTLARLGNFSLLLAAILTVALAMPRAAEAGKTKTSAGKPNTCASYGKCPKYGTGGGCVECENIMARKKKR
jgi:hypothetical protein